MDDTIRDEEKDVCKRWAADYNFYLDYFPLEKGLGRLTKQTSDLSKNSIATTAKPQESEDNNLGLDFTISNDTD